MSLSDVLSELSQHFTSKRTLIKLTAGVAFCCAVFSDKPLAEPRTPDYQYDAAYDVYKPADFDMKNLSEANQQLVEFPMAIDGAASVHKYITPGARQVLVHIRQMHLIRDIPDSTKEIVRFVQDDISAILTYLHENRDLREIYREGKCPPLSNLEKLKSVEEVLADSGAQIKDNPKYDQLKMKVAYDKLTIAERTLVAAKIDRSETDVHLDVFEKKKEIERDLEQSLAIYPESAHSWQTYLTHDAVFHATRMGKIQTLACEDFGLNFVAVVGTFPSKAVQDEYRMDKREDVSLLSVAENGDQIAYTVYGGAHAWGGILSFGETYSQNRFESGRDNIAQWNRENPDHTFSLIEIVPNSYPLFTDEKLSENIAENVYNSL